MRLMHEHHAYLELPRFALMLGARLHKFTNMNFLQLIRSVIRNTSRVSVLWGHSLLPQDVWGLEGKIKSPRSALLHSQSNQ